MLVVLCGCYPIEHLEKRLVVSNRFVMLTNIACSVELLYIHIRILLKSFIYCGVLFGLIT